MTDPSFFLAQRHGITEYKTVTQSSPAGSAVRGFVYVETDRYLPSKTPAYSSDASKEDVERALKEWTRAPLQELEFLRRIVEDTPQEGDGFEKGAGELLKGAVVWAPFNVSHSAFNAYLAIAEAVAGPKLWEKIVGFRYLLQGKEKGEAEELVGSNDWIENIVSLGQGRQGKGWVFDVGVDIHRDGTGPQAAVGEMIQRVREREAQSGGGSQPVRFVLNHLCKHVLTTDAPTKPDQAWLQALSKAGSDENIFMKLSGAFNEFDNATPASALEVVQSVKPIVSKIFDAFGDRVMFGSDWPVCNVGGPAGERGNWGLWVETVELLLKEFKVDVEGSDSIWWRAGSRAYDVQL